VSATTSRDLRSGRSLWSGRRLPPIGRITLAARDATDVLVVGAGISGALVAERLASDGHRVLVLDRRGPALGSTAASTALVQYEIDEPLTGLTRRIGAADASRAWRRSFLALRGLAARTGALGIDAALDPRDSLYLAGASLDAAALAREGEARRAIGLETALIDRATLRRRHDIDRPAALVAYGNFGADPRRLTAGYLRAAIAAGARLAAPAELIGFEPKADRLEARTADSRILCRTIVFATGYEFPKLVPLTGHRLISTWALATRPQPRRLWPGRCLVWEAADPYIYARTTPEGRAILGGEDEEFADTARRDALIPEKTAAIVEKARRLFPRLDPTPEFAWTGTFGASDTGLPSIGEIPRHPGVWAVLGYGGNGITYSRIAAELIGTALAGGTDPDADLYAFRR
jgi:glycine/D-amino acid oxidase-like deaminating enzyme